jgi:hypothetical protein
MVNRLTPDDDNILADRLKREAAASRPAFSESLHARICRAIEQSKLQTARRPAAVQWRWAYAAIAATLLVGVSLVAWRLSNAPGTGPPPPVEDFVQDDSARPLRELPRLDQVDHTVTQVGSLVDSTLTAGQWAYLDHDARLAAELLIDQFPFDLTEQGDL